MIRDIAWLEGLQNPDGGWPVWQRGYDSWPCHSIHAAHALARAQKRGYQVSGRVLDGGRRYLGRIESHIPRWYNDQIRSSLTAQALYVLTHLGENNPRAAKKFMLETGLDNLPVDALGFLLFVLHHARAMKKSGTRSAGSWATGWPRPRGRPISFLPTATRDTCCCIPTVGRTPLSWKP